MKQFRRRKTSSMKLDIAPLLDVMFMLLLFFMLTSSFLKPSIKLKLPKASNAIKEKNQNVVVAINQNGIIYVNQKLIKIEQLSSYLKIELKSNDESKVIFQADENIKYKQIVKYLDLIKNSGAKEINLVHETNL